MPKVSVTAVTTADPERVYQVLADPSRTPEWNDMHQGFTGDVPATLAEGTTYKQKVKLMGMPAEMAWKVVAADAGKVLEQAGDGPMGVKSKNRFLLEPADGGTQITYDMEFNGPALNGPMAAMLEKQAGPAAKQALEKLKGLVE
ncbi:type II toxin-antitoxin system Rv0910 family toxin [Actinoplanes aureus]|uniref:SRPBCC family protein n=1 Tax=Actinoplanes aureus TaxID=2792083 RepID=A0A931CD85_9ACTN|nr:SRPBCC family protein [Actinoplanes aureus]MBG0565028.1 SRPBCC family protein [Actinoplanes aureus]